MGPDEGAEDADATRRLAEGPCFIGAGRRSGRVAIRARIRKLIADEEPEKPLSDAQIAEVLSREGVKVARRTVAKYREALGLAPSSERRQATARASA